MYFNSFAYDHLSKKTITSGMSREIITEFKQIFLYTNPFCSAVSDKNEWMSTNRVKMLTNFALIWNTHNFTRNTFHIQCWFVYNVINEYLLVNMLNDLRTNIQCVCVCFELCQSIRKSSPKCYGITIRWFIHYTPNPLSYPFQIYTRTRIHTQESEHPSRMIRTQECGSSYYCLQNCSWRQNSTHSSQKNKWERLLSNQNCTTMSVCIVYGFHPCADTCSSL